jgi:hypothetical protein
MIVLHSGSGAGDFELEGEALSAEAQDELFFTAARLLTARGEVHAAGLLATMDFRIYTAHNHFNDAFEVLYATTPLEQYEYLNQASEKDEFRRIFRQIASTINELEEPVFIRFIACGLERVQAPPNWRADLQNLIASLTANQALFTYRESGKIVYQRLNFRSKTEIRIYDKLISRGLLVFPLPVAVMGVGGRYKEPDFLVLRNGKAGILEIHGDKWHPPETAASEHERRREFTRLGIAVYEIFDSKRCWEDPSGVVEEFLRAFEQ